MKQTTPMAKAGALLLLALACFCAPAGAASADPAASSGDLACVSWTTEARFNGVAYSHLVHLVNGCKIDVKCQVVTTANPEPVLSELGVGERKTVVTIQGSPAREFSAWVRCQKK